MKLSRFSIHRPIFTTMVVLIVIVLGTVSLQRLSIDLLPDITMPRLSVSTSYANASPEEIETLITRPIEEAMSAVSGVEEVSSTSSEGRSNVTVTFTWGTNIDEAANDMRDRLDRVIPRLPDDADRPRLRKFDLADFPILILGASSDLDPVQMRRIIDEQISYRLERVPGVAAVDIWGGRDREIHVDIDPDKIRAIGLSLDEVVARIRAGNVNLPAGSIRRGTHEVTIRTPGEYRTLDELRDTEIANRGGSSILLSEVAEVKDAWQRVTRIARFDGRMGVRLSINKQSGTNTVAVAGAVLEEVERINHDLPHINLVPIIDQSEFIQRSIRNVSQAAIVGGVLAIFVLLLFLRNLRSTAVIATAIPVSIIATFGLIYFGGFTLNLMTLGGLALGIGMLVDNSIVVLENIYRLREQGQEPLEAAVNGSEEVTAAIIASTLTTLIVFVPLIFVRGMAGVMFQQLAYVIVFALLCSLIVALTFVPMLAGRLLQVTSINHANNDQTLSRKVFRASGLFFRAMDGAYKRLLHSALEHRLLVVVLALILLGGSVFLIPLVGTELMPESDEGELRVTIEMEVGTQLDIVDRQTQEIEAIVRREVPEIDRMMASAGAGGFRARGGHTGFLRVSLVPQSQRERSSDEIAQALRRRLGNIPGATVRIRSGSGMGMLGRMMGGGGGERLQIEVRGHDLETADELAERVQAAVENVPGVTDASTSRDIGTPEELIVIDRRRAADMGLSVRQIAGMLQTVLSGTIAGNFREAGDEYTIRVQVADAEYLDLEDILDLTLTNSAGESVVLRNVAQLQPRLGPTHIERKDQERVVTISANIADRDMGSIVADMREALNDIPIPRGFSIVFGGEYEEQQEAFAELLTGLLLALFLVYMVMACQYESLRDPFVVMFSVPLAVIGVVLMLFLTRTSFSIQAFIGCIMLGGIVVNNAILLVDHTNLLRRRDGMPLRAAIEEGGRRRLRPILMTALTTILGLTPLALGLGEGGEAQAPMARAVIGGLISSTVITLVFVPVVYSLLEHGFRKLKDTEETGAFVGAASDE